jgi:hypothetical protein
VCGEPLDFQFGSIIRKVNAVMILRVISGQTESCLPAMAKKPLGKDARDQ